MTVMTAATKVQKLENAIANGYRALQIQLRDLRDAQLIMIEVSLNVNFEVLKAEAQRLIDAYKPIVETGNAIATNEEKATAEQRKQEYLNNADPMGIYRNMTQENAVMLAPGTYETWRDIQEELGQPSLPRHIARQKYNYATD